MRREFPKLVKREALSRANGFCEGPGCGAALHVGRYHFDHDIPDGLGGEPELWNCKVLCHACHSVKTRTIDVPTIAKAKRVNDKQNGIKKPRAITRWRRFDGSIREAGRER